jgi:peptidoglycan/LPS O-acetylase OafA/YrhL
MWPVCQRAPALFNMFAGIYFLVDGFLALLIAVIHRTRISSRLWLLADSAAGIIAGILIMGFSPAGDMLPLPSVITIIVWALLTGICEVIIPWRHKGELTGKWIFITGGLLSLLLGVLLIFSLNTSLEATCLVIYWIILGILFMVLGFSGRNVGDQSY